MVNLKHEDERLTAVLEREEKDIKRLMEVINMIDRYILFENEVYSIKKQPPSQQFLLFMMLQSINQSINQSITITPLSVF